MKVNVHLRKAADEGVLFTRAVLRVQAEVEGGGVAGVHPVQAHVELRRDAAPQVPAAAGELKHASC